MHRYLRSREQDDERVGSRAIGLGYLGRRESSEVSEDFELTVQQTPQIEITPLLEHFRQLRARHNGQHLQVEVLQMSPKLDVTWQ